VRLHGLLGAICLATVRTVALTGLRVHQQDVTLAVGLVLWEAFAAQLADIDTILRGLHVFLHLIRTD
jgi:hypothetical protein